MGLTQSAHIFLERRSSQVSKLRTSLDGAPGRTGFPELPSWAMEAFSWPKVLEIWGSNDGKYWWKLCFNKRVVKHFA